MPTNKTYSSNVSSSMFFGKNSSLQGKYVVPTPLINPKYFSYYYVDVKKISIGGQIFPIPSRVFHDRNR
jgi:hypothetical protein